MRQQLKQSQKRIRIYETEIYNLRDVKYGYEKEIKDLKDEITELREIVIREELNESIETYEELGILQSEHKSVKEKLVEKEEIILDKRKEIVRLMEEVRAMGRKMAELSEQRSPRQRNVLQKELREVEEQYRELYTKYRLLEKENQHLEERLKKATEELESETFSHGVEIEVRNEKLVQQKLQIESLQEELRLIREKPQA